MSESSTLFIWLPHVSHPQPQDGSHLRLFDLHLHSLVAHTLQPYCNNSVHTLVMGSNSNSFGFHWLLQSSRNLQRSCWKFLSDRKEKFRTKIIGFCFVRLLVFSCCIQPYSRLIMALTYMEFQCSQCRRKTI